MATIDKIEQDGEVYTFVDEECRGDLVRLSKRVSSINDDHNEKISAETERATSAEAAINARMDDIPVKPPDMYFSHNDFTDAYKSLVDSPLPMVGASATEDGKKGAVPKPSKGDEGKFLRGDGTWVAETTYDVATQQTAGLMSAADKYKFDNAKLDNDDELGSTTVFNGNKITQTINNGRIKTTTFNADGSITEEIVKAGADKITLVTTFNEDGSITRTRT